MTNAEVTKTADIWEQAMKKLPDAIELATVYTKRIRNDGSGGGEDEYYGKEMDLVIKKAKSVVDAIDEYQSPSRGDAWLSKDGYWHVSVRWWGLGG